MAHRNGSPSKDRRRGHRRHIQAARRRFHQRGNESFRLSEQLAARIAARALRSPKTENASPLNLLSDRELCGFQMIGQGYSTRQIAETLHLDMRTVETYRSRIKEKLNLKDGSELLQYAIRWAQAEGPR